MIWAVTKTKPPAGVGGEILISTNLERSDAAVSEARQNQGICPVAYFKFVARRDFSPKPPLGAFCPPTIWEAHR